MLFEYITPQIIIIFAVFIVVVFVLYKLFKLAFRTLVVAMAAFSFPWVVSFLNLPLPVTPDIQTGTYFAILGVVLYLIYEFFHVIIHILKFLLSPFRRK